MTSEIPQRTEVFIVGAGPTGLAAALALHKQGCRDMVIVDSILAGENTSRALVVHAATLEVRFLVPSLMSYSDDEHTTGS